MPNKKIIYTVSPNYLRAIYKESKEFSFYIQGYGNFIYASKGLLHTNISDILGVCILLEYVDEEIDDFVYFIETLNIVADKLPVVIGVKDPQGLDLILKFADTSNLKIFYINEFDIVTDVFIRRTLFGTILKESREQYENVYEEKKDVKLFNYSNSNCLESMPVLTKPALICLSELDFAHSFSATVNGDLCLKQLVTNSIFYHIRLLCIEKHFDDFEGVSKRCKIIDAILYKMSIDNDKDYILCKCLYELALEKRL